MRLVLGSSSEAQLTQYDRNFSSVKGLESDLLFVVKMYVVDDKDPGC